MPVLQVASSSSGKMAEFRLAVHLWLERGRELRRAAQRLDESSKLIDVPDWTVQPVPGFDALPPCVEDGDSFAANARKKAIHYSGFVDGMMLGDDSGLEVASLSGAPGIRSRRFAGEYATDEQNNAKLLQLLKSLPTESRTAQFVCALALAQGGEVIAEFRGIARGVVLESPRGTGGFGYDPLFLNPESNKTFAELSAEEKLDRSHRGQAMLALLEWLSGEAAKSE